MSKILSVFFEERIPVVVFSKFNYPVLVLGMLMDKIIEINQKQNTPTPKLILKQKKGSEEGEYEGLDETVFPYQPLEPNQSIPSYLRSVWVISSSEKYSGYKHPDLNMKRKIILTGLATLIFIKKRQEYDGIISWAETKYIALTKKEEFKPNELSEIANKLEKYIPFTQLWQKAKAHGIYFRWIHQTHYLRTNKCVEEYVERTTILKMCMFTTCDILVISVLYD